MLIYNHMYFTSCSFLDFCKYNFYDDEPVYYQTKAQIDQLSIDIENNTIGIGELWNEHMGEYDEF